MAVNNLDVTSRILYKGTLPEKVEIVFNNANLFHRIDYHEDGSQSEYFGIEINKTTFDNLSEQISEGLKMSLDRKLTGHDTHCPVCKSHLTSLYLCPMCIVRYDDWYRYEQALKYILIITSPDDQCFQIALNALDNARVEERDGEGGA